MGEDFPPCDSRSLAAALPRCAVAIFSALYVYTEAVAVAHVAALADLRLVACMPLPIYPLSPLVLLRLDRASAPRSCGLTQMLAWWRHAWSSYRPWARSRSTCYPPRWPSAALR
jgi:hypothetical protein